jgi:hypothetical protein
MGKTRLSQESKNALGSDVLSEYIVNNDKVFTSSPVNTNGVK